MRCVSSRFRTAEPRPSAASMNLTSKTLSMDFSPRFRLINQPAHGKRITTGRHFNGNLVGCTTNTSRFNLNRWGNASSAASKASMRVFAPRSLNDVQRTIDDLFCDCFLATDHYVVHELSKGDVAVLWIREDIPFRWDSSSRHGYFLFRLIGHNARPYWTPSVSRGASG